MVVSDNCDEETIAMRKGYAGKVKYKGEDYYIFNIPCVYLCEVTGRCSIYKDRPELCKRFPGKGFSDFWKLVNPKCGLLEDD